MAKAGRKRKIGVQRERNGQVQRVYVNPRQQVCDQPHRVVVPVNFREFSEAGSEFGRMMLLKRITPAQYEAGNQYAELAAQYRAALQAPAVDPAAIDLGKVGKGRGEGMRDETAKSIAKRYNLAFEACTASGVRAQLAVKDFAVLDRHCDNQLALDLLIVGLNSLVKHFGIDSKLQISSREK